MHAALRSRRRFAAAAARVNTQLVTAADRTVIETGDAMVRHIIIVAAVHGRARPPADRIESGGSYRSSCVDSPVVFTPPTAAESCFYWSNRM